MNGVDRTEVVIVGAGPVGLTFSLLLSQFGVDHWVVEQRRKPADHPQAHFISTRSMEIFAEIPGLAAAIRERTPPLDEWRRFIYCTDLYHLPQDGHDGETSQGSLLAARDHFPHGPDKALSPRWESHLPQHQLVKLLRTAAATSPHCRLLEDHRAEVHDDPVEVKVDLLRGDGREIRTVHCPYAVLADGAHGAGREAVGIGRQQVTSLRQSFISAHFFSPQLSEVLSRRILAMLYFIYAPAGVGILINHGLQQGEFVLQLPVFPPHQGIDGFTKPVCAELIDRLAGTPVQAEIRSVRPWRLNAWVADGYQSATGRCFLVGDAAHQFLPAGGLGLNCGLADAHNLAWKLARALRGRALQHHEDTADRKLRLLSSYTEERLPVAGHYLELSRTSFNKTLAVSAALGLNWQAARWLDGLMQLLPLPGFMGSRLFRLGMQLGLRQLDLFKSDSFMANRRRRQLARLFENPEDNLALRYPRADLGMVYQRGWRMRAGASGGHSAGKTDPCRAAVIGARLPHFWLRPTGVRTTEPLSSLDLAPQAAHGKRAPQHLLLLIDLPLRLGRRLADLRAAEFGPLCLVRISTGAGNDADTDYHLHTSDTADEGVYHPSRGALLVRPDGMVAWAW